MRPFFLHRLCQHRYRKLTAFFKSIRNLGALLLLTFSLHGPAYASGGCQALFSYKADSSGNGIQFTDSSFGSITNHWWYFGDGSTSTKQNPFHSYSSAGAYQVCLIVMDSVSSCVDTFCTYVQVTGNAQNCKAAFSSYSDTSGYVYFTSNSYGNNNSSLGHFWTFGDGSGSSDRDPVHQYSQPGTYNVCLTIIDSLNNCTDKTCSSITVSKDSVNCFAYYSYYQDSSNSNTIWFYNYSAGGTSFQWSFGDGTYSADENPSHTFPGPGTYYVCLTLKDSSCASTYCSYVTIYDSTNAPCKAYFSYNVGSGRNVSFYNYSTGKPVNVSWSFGDGNVSSSHNPVHQYAADGVYKVCLTVWTDSSACYDTYCSYVQVYSSPACQAYFSYNVDSGKTVSFYNYSTGNITNYFWDFGDGSTSTDQTPSHQYSAAGYYYVCLTVTDSSGACSDTYCKYVNITDPATNCYASFYAYPDTGSSNGVQFYNASYGNPTSFFWDFGDGTNSTQKDPYHVYSSPGTFRVCLTISNGSCKDTYCTYVNAGSDTTGCFASFVIYPDSTKSGMFYFQSFINGQIYKWDFGDSTYAYQGQDPTHYYANNGTYKVCLTVVNDSCMVTYCDSVVVSRPVGVNKPSAAANSLNIYPNPVKGTAYLGLRLEESSTVSVVIQTLLGSTVGSSVPEQLSSGDHRIELSTRTLPPGIYFVKVLMDSSERVIRLVVTD